MRVVMQFGPHAGQAVLVSPLVGRALLADGRARALPPEGERATAGPVLGPDTIQTPDPAIAHRDPVPAARKMRRFGRHRS